uniref:Uncharacterized protein n=1 Tax=Candidatus Kentrum sp. FM TaxID=2126340 RepID=A0A450WXT6_9GAMM|nr:MAG: hypothetical protein BECKFM1743B_GA0114221_108201 [Candidatus Kentron sp. FM]
MHMLEIVHYYCACAPCIRALIISINIEIKMERTTRGEHLGSPVRSPERRGESCIRPLCLIRPYAQKLRLHRAMLYALRRSTRNPIRAINKLKPLFRFKAQ